jgi:peptide/nickel transport system ATP-binding protein
MTVVEVEQLQVVLAGQSRDIVDEVSFHIDEGEVLGLVGESGSGKTTVGLALLGHTRRGAMISGGAIRFNGRDLLQLPPEEVRSLRGRSLSYVPQDPASALNPALRIGLQLEETLVAHGYKDSRRERLAEMLAEVALPTDSAFLKRYPHQLSGGQQQRVALAMAFACRPAVIVLDEPTTGLDVTTQSHVLETVRELCTTHKVAALYISHDLAVVASVANRVAVMYAGRVVEVGPDRLLFEAAAHPYTRRLVEAIPEMSGEHALEGIEGSAPLPGQRPQGCFFAPRCSFAIDACLVEFPQTEQVSEGHVVRCHRYIEVVAQDPLDRKKALRSRPTSPAQSLLDVGELSVAYGPVKVVHDVSFAIEKEQCVALVGESGAGKSTLARCIGGIHWEATGTMRLQGRPLPFGAEKRDRETRRKIQYIFQNPYNSLNPRKTIGQLVGQPLRSFFSVDRNEEYRRVARALERVSLSPLLVDAYPHELSGGERQRVAIARALVAEPALLICDEVTSALDVSVQAAIIDLIMELRRELGVGVLFVTHNLALIRTIADTVIVMSQGRIVEHGNSDAVFEAPEAPYTRSLLANTPSLEKAIAAGRDDRVTTER